MTAITVVLVDDHAMVAESFPRVLASADDISVVAVEGTVEDAVRASRNHHPDVVVMDYALPDGDGATAARRIIEEQPNAKILLLTGISAPQALSAAVEAGCVGYLEKTGALERLVGAVRAAAAGETVLSPDALGRVVRRHEYRDRTALTARELDVLALMGEGLSNQAIAERLVLSLNTVRTHVQTVLMKLEAHSKLEAVVIAGHHGLLPPP